MPPPVVMTIGILIASIFLGHIFMTQTRRNNVEIVIDTMSRREEDEERKKKRERRRRATEVARPLDHFARKLSCAENYEQRL